MYKLLVGTGNKTRLEYVKGILEELNIQIFGLNDLNISYRAKENGNTAIENSLNKALTYNKISKIPTLAIDAGLYIDNFPKEKQPGLYVRRIGLNKSEVSDEEMLHYYIKELKKYGGESKGYWEIGITLVNNENEIYKTTFQRATNFISTKSNIYSENEPLNSIQIDYKTGKYVSELNVQEKIESQNDLAGHIFEFVKINIG